MGKTSDPCEHGQGTENEKRARETSEEHWCSMLMRKIGSMSYNRIYGAVLGVIGRDDRPHRVQRGEVGGLCVC